MATLDFYGSHVDRRRKETLPSAGGTEPTRYSYRLEQPLPELPLTPTYESPPYPDHRNDSSVHLFRDGRSTDSRHYSDDIPLRPHAPNDSSENEPSPKRAADLGESGTSSSKSRARRRKRGAEHREALPGKTPWVVYGITLIQVTIFIAELVKNSILTQLPIEIHPQVNPMLGPSIYVLINMGARYVPCMKPVPVPVGISWPCPWTTTADPSDPMNNCTLSELCGFDPVESPNFPNQWFRFIIPMFLHAGIIHIGFNMLLQLTLGREMEKIVGSFRFLLVYLSSGIFGFVLGGNFAASGIASMGASGALFGIIAIMLLDLLYTWKDRVAPVRELLFIVLDVVVSFVLGLLPGLDNFSHIGGFLMGLILGVCILHSPNALRERVEQDGAGEAERQQKRKRKRAPKFDGLKEFIKDPVAFFKGRKGMWWAWWMVRAVALIGVMISFVVLLNNFYVNHNTCSWCKYLSCLPIKNWCDIGNLQVINATSTKRDLSYLMRDRVDLGPFF